MCIYGKTTITFLLLSLVLGGSSLSAQQQKTASISGILISKATSKPLSGRHLHLFRFVGNDKKGNARVELFILNNSFPRARTNVSGEFTFSKLPAGEYVILTGTETATDPDDSKTYLHNQSGALLTLKVKPGDAMNLGKIEVTK